MLQGLRYPGSLDVMKAINSVKCQQRCNDLEVGIL